MVLIFKKYIGGKVTIRDDINIFVFYQINDEQNTMRITHKVNSLTNFYNDLLCIVQDNDNGYHYFRISFVDKKIYADEIANGNNTPTFPISIITSTIFSNDFNIPAQNGTTKQYFKGVYGKYT